MLAPQDFTLDRWAVSIHAAYDTLGGPEEAAGAQQVCREVSTYFRDVISQRRKNPKTDFVSSMLGATRCATQFSDDEILGNLMQIVPGPDVLMMLIRLSTTYPLKAIDRSGRRDNGATAANGWRYYGVAHALELLPDVWWRDRSDNGGAPVSAAT